MSPILKPETSLSVRSIQGALLVQQPDVLPDDTSAWKVVSQRQPTGIRTRRSPFRLASGTACQVECHRASQRSINCRGGAGQPNRVESVNIAVRKAGVRAAGSVLASDAFFPFADGVEAAIAAGVTAVVQPGGSMRDDEVLAAVNTAGITMIVTGARHFLH